MSHVGVLRTLAAIVFVSSIMLATPALAKRKAKPAATPPATDALSALTTRAPGTFGRVSSADRSVESVLAERSSLDLAVIEGPAIIDRIWIAIEGSDTFARDIVLRITWDGAGGPSVEAPIGDFFAVGPGARQELSSLPMQVQSEGRSFASFWKMPFAEKATITLVNQGRSPTRQLLWEVDYRTLPAAPADSLYFHAQYVQGSPPPQGKPLQVLRASGKGHWVGLSLTTQLGEPGAWGTGAIRVSVDGDPGKGPGAVPVLNYFGHLFGIDVQNGAWQGATLDEGTREKARSSLYRFHVQDPIPFDKSIQVAVDHGVGNERTDRIATVAYWYQDSPEGPFEQLAAVRDRSWEPPTADELAAWKRADELNLKVLDAYRRKDLESAYTLLKELVALEPQLVYAAYNLACLHALRGETDAALHQLEAAIELGFTELSFARQDPDLGSLHEHERFRKLVEMTE